MVVLGRVDVDVDVDVDDDDVDDDDPAVTEVVGPEDVGPGVVVDVGCDVGGAVVDVVVDEGIVVVVVAVVGRGRRPDLDSPLGPPWVLLANATEVKAPAPTVATWDPTPTVATGPRRGIWASQARGPSTSHRRRVLTLTIVLATWGSNWDPEHRTTSSNAAAWDFGLRW